MNTAWRCRTFDGIQPQATSTDVPTVLQDSKFRHAWIEGHEAENPLFPCNPGRGLQATQLAEIKLPRLDVMRCTWCVAPRDPTWWRTLQPHHLAYLNVGWAYPTRMSLNLIWKALKAHLSMYFKSFHNTFAKSEICSTTTIPLIRLPSTTTSHIYIPSKQNRPRQQHQPTEIPPASATEPFTSRRIARPRTDPRVSGCTGPSWPSRPLKAVR